MACHRHAYALSGPREFLFCEICGKVPYDLVAETPEPEFANRIVMNRTTLVAAIQVAHESAPDDR